MLTQQLRQNYTLIKALLNRPANKVFNHTPNQYCSTGVMYLSIQKLYHCTCMLHLTASKNYTAVHALHISPLTQRMFLVPEHNHQGSNTAYSTCHLCEISVSPQRSTYLFQTGNLKYQRPVSVQAAHL